MPSSRDAAGDASAAVAAALWTEREALETVLFKMEEERLVILSGSSRWLHTADDELRGALIALHSAEVLRAMEVDDLAGLLDLPDGTTLADLASSAPEPWPLVFAEHRALLRTLVEEVECVAEHNGELLRSGVAAAREAVDAVAGPMFGWDSDNGGVVVDLRPRVADCGAEHG